MDTGRWIAILLLCVGCAGCGVCRAVGVVAWGVVSAPFEAAHHESLNHHFTMAGTVVDEEDRALNDVTVHVLCVTPEKVVLETEKHTIDKAFSFDRHGWKILLWFTKDGYRDVKVALVAEGNAPKPHVSNTWGRFRERLDYDFADATFHVGQEQKRLKVVLPRHTGGKLKTVTAELSGPWTPSSLSFTREMLPPGMWTPSPMGEENPTVALKGMYFGGVPIEAAQDVQRLDDMRIAPLLAFHDAGLEIELHPYQTKPVPGQSYLFFARIGLCYARGMVTLHSADANHQRASLVLQIQEDGSRELP